MGRQSFSSLSLCSFVAGEKGHVDGGSKKADENDDSSHAPKLRRLAGGEGASSVDWSSREEFCSSIHRRLLFQDSKDRIESDDKTQIFTAIQDANILMDSNKKAEISRL